METGKVEYAPDYKSTNYKSTAKIKRAYPDMTDKFKAMELRAEHQRLQSAVVEAAKEEVAMALIQLQRAMKTKKSAVDALIAFEAEHGIGND